MAVRPTGKALESRKTGNAATLERNGLIIMMREAQLLCIENMRKVCYDIPEMRREAERYNTRVLRGCAGLLGRGENPQIIISAIGQSTALSIIAPGVRPGASDAVYGRLSPVLEKMAAEQPKIKSFWEKCKTSAAGDTPFTAETAALAEIAMNTEYFTRVRGARKDREKELAAEHEFLDARSKLFACFEDDQVDSNELMQANQAAVVELVMSHPDPYSYMFNYIWDDFRVDFSQVTRAFGPGRSGYAKSTFQAPIGGLSYLKSGNRFLYRFSFRPVYSFNMYDDMVYDETKEHFGPVLLASRTGDKTYLSTPAYQYSIHRVQSIQRMMKMDNYTDAEIAGVMRAAGNRCEMYYATETPSGRKEWAESHPEEVSELEAEKARRGAGEKAKKEHIKVASAAQETEAIEWLSCPADETYEPELMRQAGSKLAPGVRLQDTFREQDYVQLASVMAEFAESINPLEDPYNLERWYVPLKADPEACMDRFIRRFFRMRMDPWQRRRYDLVSLARKTAEPLLDKDRRIVAIRAVGNLVAVGDTGGMVRGASHVGAGCWVDERSGITNTKLSGSVMVLMQSNIKDSQLDGAGIIANTMIMNSKVSGPMDPSRMRKDAGMGASAGRLLTIDSQNLDYNVEGFPEEQAAALDAAKRQAMLRASLYKDKTVDVYLEELNERMGTDQRLQKLTPEEIRRKKEEERQRHAEQSRLMHDKGMDYAAIEDISRGMRAIGVPEHVIRAGAARGVEAAQVDSVDLTAEADAILSRHKQITSAISRAQHTEEVQAAKAAQEAAAKDIILPGKDSRFL